MNKIRKIRILDLWLTTHEQDRQGWLGTHSGASKQKKQQQLLGNFGKIPKF